MGAGQLIAVADAGPLIHLAEIGSLEILSAFELIHVPEAVWRETVGQGRVTTIELDAVGNVARCSVSASEITTYLSQEARHRLHPGERECLAYCRREGVGMLLTDDLSVREAAKQLGLRPVGSLGVVIRAYRACRIDLAEAERSLQELFDTSTLFVTRAIVDLAIKELHKIQPSAQP